MRKKLTCDEKRDLLSALDDYYDISEALKSRGLEGLVNKSLLLDMAVQKELEYLTLKNALVRELQDWEIEDD